MTAQAKIAKANGSAQVAPFYPPEDACKNPPWEIDVYRAVNNPTRWHRFNQRATSCHAALGFDSVRQTPSVDTNQFDTYFAEATVVGALGRRVAVGGIKVHAVDGNGDVPLYAELTEHLNVKILRSFVSRFCSLSLCHSGGLWVDRRFSKTELVADLAYACVPMILAMETTWCVAVTQVRIMDAWSSLGWHKLKRFPNFSYPDSRYESAIVLSSIATWPPEVKQWAGKQIEKPVLSPHAPDALFRVQPLRPADGASTE